MKKIFKNKKIIIGIIISVVLVSVFGYRKHQKRIEEERLASAITLVDNEVDRFIDDLFLEENINTYTVEGRTDLMIKQLSMVVDKEEVIYEAKYDESYEYAWDLIIKESKKNTDRMEMVLKSNDYDDIEVLTYIVDEDEDVVAVIYDGVVYYDMVKGIDRHKKLEKELRIDIDLEELE